MQDSWREGRRGGRGEGGGGRGEEGRRRGDGGGGREGGREGRREGRREGYSHESWRIRMNRGAFAWGEFHFVTAYPGGRWSGGIAIV